MLTETDGIRDVVILDQSFTLLGQFSEPEITARGVDLFDSRESYPEPPVLSIVRPTVRLVAYNAFRNTTVSRLRIEFVHHT
ncbi:hypothetical protein D8S78_22405 [Natrialba swarupiae]|nr:hypothetical protein [Natrialba swarupiae]